MTDLERAHSCAAEIADLIAAARREGYEEAAKEYVEALRQVYESGAEEMRERAKAACHERSQWAASKITNENADAMWATYSNACDDCLYFIAALPLTPEERT